MTEEEEVGQFTNQWIIMTSSWLHSILWKPQFGVVLFLFVLYAYLGMIIWICHAKVIDIVSVVTRLKLE